MPDWTISFVSAGGFCHIARRFNPPFLHLSAHIGDTKLAAFVKLPSGSWRAVVRRKGRYISETFRRRADASIWALEAERQIDRGETPKCWRIARLRTFGDLIDLHIADMTDVGRAPGRSKSATLRMLKRELGSRNMLDLDRERVIRFGQTLRARRWARHPWHRYRHDQGSPDACRRRPWRRRAGRACEPGAGRPGNGAQGLEDAATLHPPKA